MSNHRRDASPIREATKPDAMSLEDQVVAWMGDEAYRKPHIKVHSRPLSWWAWEDGIKAFLKQYKVPKSKKCDWPYHAVVCFMLQQRSMRSDYLAILLQRMLSMSPDAIRKTSDKMRPLAKALGIENYAFWNDLNTAINQQIQFVFWDPPSNGSSTVFLNVRYGDITRISTQYDHNQFFSTGCLASDRDVILKTSDEIPWCEEFGPRASILPSVKEEGQAARNALESAIAWSLPNILVQTGFFQFPHTGDDRFYRDMKYCVLKHSSRDMLVWDDERQTVKIKMAPIV